MNRGLLAVLLAGCTQTTAPPKETAATPVVQGDKETNEDPPARTDAPRSRVVR